MIMDGNKDDALKCLKICKDAMKAGDRPRALKFLSKARRLDPDLQIDDLLSDLNNQSEKPESRKSPGSATGAKDSLDSSDRPSLRQRGSSTTSPSSSSKSYTEEQISIVRKIKSKKDYYEILGLENNCSVDDIRKAYRKLSLKVHPDKNQAPGSEEAFKSVSKAFQCLSNEEARKKYDVSGSDEPIYQPRRSSARSNGFNGGYYYEDEFDPNEIFRSFFGGGGMPPATAQFRTFNFGASRHRTTNNHQAPDAGFNARILLQLLPVILILLINFMPSSQPVYQLSSTYPYNYKFTTQKGVNYFVRSSKFEQDYPRDSNDRYTLEEQVERDYVSILSQNCRYELQRQQWGFVRETPHCDMMRRFEETAAYKNH